jgi:predicted transcriptional regulator
MFTNLALGSYKQMFRKFVSIFLVFLLVIISFKIVLADSPPPIPTVVYGNVVNDESAVMSGITVTASWTNNNELLKKSTRTITLEESKASGGLLQAGSYRFDEGIYIESLTKVKLESEGTSIEVDVRPGTITNAPNIVVPKRTFSATGQSNPTAIFNQGLWENLFNYLTELFKFNEQDGSNPPGMDQKESPNGKSSSGKTNGFSSGNGKTENGSGYGKGSSNFGENFSGKFSNEENGSSFGNYTGNLSGKFQGESNLSGNISGENYSGFEEETNSDRKPAPKESTSWEETFKKNFLNKGGNLVNLKKSPNLYYFQYLIFPADYEKQGNYRSYLILSIFLGSLLLIILLRFIWKKIFKEMARRNFEKYPSSISALTCNSFVSEKVIQLNQKDSFLEALEAIMGGNSFIPIIDNKKAVGIIRVKDVLSKIGNWNVEILEKLEVNKVMNKNFISCDASTKIIDCCKLMLDKGYDEVIVEKNGVFQGVIDHFQILNLLTKLKIDIENPPILKDIMQENALIVDKNESVDNIRKLLLEKKSNYVLVGTGKGFGIVTSKDVLSSKAKYPGADLRAVSIMSGNVFSLEPWNSLFEAVKIMSERRYNQIPLISGKLLLGIIDVQSVTKLYYETIIGLIKNSSSL